MRAMERDGATRVEIAKEFGVHASRVSQLLGPRNAGSLSTARRMGRQPKQETTRCDSCGLDFTYERLTAPRRKCDTCLATGVSNHAKPRLSKKVSGWHDHDCPRCAYEGCITRISHYNEGPYCFHHEAVVEAETAAELHRQRVLELARMNERRVVPLNHVVAPPGAHAHARRTVRQLNDEASGLSKAKDTLLPRHMACLAMTTVSDREPTPAEREALLPYLNGERATSARYDGSVREHVA